MPVEVIVQGAPEDFPNPKCSQEEFVENMKKSVTRRLELKPQDIVTIKIKRPMTPIEEAKALQEEAAELSEKLSKFKKERIEDNRADAYFLVEKAEKSVGEAEDSLRDIYQEDFEVQADES
ncbi:Uncharacterised protein [uncultured archaeon]|nr:Uncharacterised protein [uncultured archaeon]